MKGTLIENKRSCKGPYPTMHITRAGRLATKSTSTYNNLTNGEVNNGI